MSILVIFQKLVLFQNTGEPLRVKGVVAASFSGHILTKIIYFSGIENCINHPI
jgi:hypothetical protein